jgi:hypothetical protein
MAAGRMGARDPMGRRRPVWRLGFMMKGSPQETSLHILDVNGSSCPAYAIFQRPGCGSGGAVHK